MTTKNRTKAKGRIFEAVHETVSDLNRHDVIGKRKMNKFDALCLDPVPEHGSQKTSALRDDPQLSQAVLAVVLP